MTTRHCFDIDGMRCEVRDGSLARILFSISSAKCARACLYCFIYDKGYISFANVFEGGRMEALGSLVTDGGDVILQPGADVEITDVPDFVTKIRSLSDFGRSISFATKGTISTADISRLGQINRVLARSGRCLQICISIPTTDQWRRFEGRTSPPSDRMELLRALYSEGIMTSVAIRPVIPSVEFNEFERIFQLTRDWCYGYITGPLYAPSRLKASKQWSKVAGATLEERNVAWMLAEQKFTVIASEQKRLQMLELSKRFGVRIFEDNVLLLRFFETAQSGEYAEAIQYSLPARPEISPAM